MARKIKLIISLSWFALLASLFIHDCTHHVDHQVTGLMLLIIACGWVIGRIISEGLTALHEILTSASK